VVIFAATLTVTLMVSGVPASGDPVPTWDKKISGAKRFDLVLCDGSGSNAVCPAVLDHETGLVWERSPSTATVTDWDLPNGAVALCYAKVLGGRMGWRLPTVEELYSLNDPSTSDPALPSGHPFQNVLFNAGDLYWTITTAAFDSTFAHAVSFEQGGGNNFLAKTGGPGHLWCVRGGHGP